MAPARSSWMAGPCDLASCLSHVHKAATSRRRADWRRMTGRKPSLIVSSITARFSVAIARRVRAAAGSPYGVRGSDPNRFSGMLDSPARRAGFSDPVSLTFCPYVVFRPYRTNRGHPRLTRACPRSPVFQFQTDPSSSRQLFRNIGAGRPMSFLTDSAQMIRAILFASATASFGGFSAIILRSQGSSSSSRLRICRSTDVAPRTSLPHLGDPAEPLTQAAKSRPQPKLSIGGAKACSASKATCAAATGYQNLVDAATDWPQRIVCACGTALHPPAPSSFFCRRLASITTKNTMELGRL